jgi:carotenoid cleavage dioxygenase-like enzyme
MAQAAPAIVQAWSSQSTVPFFRVGNYAPVFDELTTSDLPVEGAIPRELSGWNLRNGPNPRNGHETPHWFTGDGMIHGVRLENGRAAWYRNRWVRTESFDKPFLLYNSDGTRNLHASVANTHGSLTKPYVTYHRANASGELIIDRGVDVPKLTMMHDFALSAEHIVLMDLPIVFRLDVARNSVRDLPYRWSDDYGARLGVLRRDDPYGPIRWFNIDPCYVFHVLNASDAVAA